MLGFRILSTPVLLHFCIASEFDVFQQAIVDAVDQFRDKTRQRTSCPISVEHEAKDDDDPLSGSDDIGEESKRSKAS